MFNKFIILFFLYSFLFIQENSCQTVYCTQSRNEKIQSLQIIRDGADLTPPVIELNKQSIAIDFDYLEASKKELYYRVLLCNADWTLAKQVPVSNYLSGFSENPFTEYVSSFNTNIPYIHYKVVFPNDDVKLKASGNYAIEIFDIDQPDTTLGVACFSVLETKVNLSGVIQTINPPTPDDYNQYLNFSIFNPNFSMNNTDKDLKIAVIQNHRWDDVRWVSQPTYNKPKELVYENDPMLYFQGGNEFHRFNITNKRINGINVYRSDFIEGYFHFDLFPDQFFFGKNSYTYNPDNNGKVYYALSNKADASTEADYTFVHFYLQTHEPFLQGTVHLSGDLTQGFSFEQTKMKYNFDSKCYELTLLLKQGAYEYQYLYAPLDKSKPLSPAPLDGNYWQTENDYSIYVYYRPLGALYDHLIGYTVVNSQIKH